MSISFIPLSGQSDDEGRALPGGASGGDAPSVSFDNLLAYTQTDAHSFEFFPPMESLERLENLVQIFFLVKADPVVLHINPVDLLSSRTGFLNRPGIDKPAQTVDTVIISEPLIRQVLAALNTLIIFILLRELRQMCKHKEMLLIFKYHGEIHLA